ACHRPVEIFLHQVSQDEAENHGRSRVSKTPHEIAEDTKGNHDQEICGITVDAEGAHENEYEHDGNHERVAHLGQLGELCGEKKANQGARDSGNPLKPDHAIDHVHVLFYHFRTRQISPRHKATMKSAVTTPCGNPNNNVFTRSP